MIDVIPTVTDNTGFERLARIANSTKKTMIETIEDIDKEAEEILAKVNNSSKIAI